jgi:hypothetical protein
MFFFSFLLFPILFFFFLFLFRAVGGAKDVAR